MTLALSLVCGAAQAQNVATPDDLRAVLTFRDEHLTIREEHEVLLGRLTVLGSDGGFGSGSWNGPTWPTDVIAAPPDVQHGWAVYRGPERLTVPDFLRAIERDDEADLLERKARRNASVGSLFAGLAVVGLATGVGGFVGTVADEPATQTRWTAVAIGGLSGSILSGVISGASRTRSDTLAHDFVATQDLPIAQEELREHNEELRRELGLSPTQAYRELDRPRRARR